MLALATSPAGFLIADTSSTVFTAIVESATVETPLLNPPGTTIDGVVIKGSGTVVMTSSKACRPVDGVLPSIEVMM
jgi:hypothetical protein